MILLTCTGGRPEAFALLEQWIRPQVGAISEWIVIDDCFPRTPMTMGQTVIYPGYTWRPGDNPTMVPNLMRGMEAIAARPRWERSKVLIIEDDECYLPGYVEHMADLLERYPLAGQSPARYFNARDRRYRVLENNLHASLCQTGFRGDEMLNYFVEILKHVRGCNGVDLSFWRTWRSRGIIDRQSNHVVSIKGMPGRGGIGMGHRYKLDWPMDPELDLLKSWIKPERAALYEQFYRAAC